MTIQRMIELLDIEHECMLRGSHDDCNRDCANCELVQDDMELHEMYTSVISLLKEQSHWIPIREKLPNFFQTVLFADAMGISMGWYSDTNNVKCFYVVDSFLDEKVRKCTEDDAPLYWMPLPKLPNVGEQK